MKAGLGQHTGLRQELRINPRLYQAMDLLTMPMMDLQQHLKQELLVNPFLELEEPDDQPEAEVTQQQEKEKQEKEDEMDWEEILLNGFDVGGAMSGSYEDREYLEPVSVETPDLDDHLREQLDLLVLTPRQRFLVERSRTIIEPEILGELPAARLARIAAFADMVARLVGRAVLKGHRGGDGGIPHTLLLFP